MKNEFAIKCNTWEEACELLVLAITNEWDLECGRFTESEFNKYNGIVYFWTEKTTIKKFWIAESNKEPIPYSKQKAIELLSGKEELRIVSMMPTSGTHKDMIFSFNDGNKIYLSVINSAYRYTEYFKLVSEYYAATKPQDEPMELNTSPTNKTLGFKTKVKGVKKTRIKLLELINKQQDIQIKHLISISNKLLDKIEAKSQQ